MILESVSFTINLLFIVTTVFTLLWIIKKLKASKSVTILLIIWLGVQALLAKKGFYEVKDTIPPRFIFALMPALIFILYLFNATKSKAYIDKISYKELTIIHIVRIPVEIVLFALYTVQLVPELMTFEGANFDIISGVTAPLIYFFVLNKENFNKNILLGWNILCLLLLLVILVIAILSAPTPLQHLAFDQPNIAVFHFPFIWLPSFIVPVVLFAHLAALRKLLIK